MNPLTCKEVYELLTDFLLEELPPEKHNAVKNHLQYCENCRKECQQLNQVIKNLRQRAGEIEMPQSLEKQIEDSLLSSPKKSWKKIISLAAVSLFLLAASLGLWSEYFAVPEEKSYLASEEAESSGGNAAESFSALENGNIDKSGMAEEPPMEQGITIQEKKENVVNIKETGSSYTALAENHVLDASPSLNNIQVIEISEAEGGAAVSAGGEQAEIIINSINSARPADNKEAYRVTHHIKVKLKDGTEYSFGYDINSNVIVLNKEVEYPGPGLAKVIKEITR